MKKITGLIMTMLLCLSLTACRGTDSNTDSDDDKVITVDDNKSNEDENSDDTNGDTNLDSEPDDNSVDNNTNNQDEDKDYTKALVTDKKYKPGTYLKYSTKLNNYNGYPFVIVDIDDYGDIDGVYIDETCQIASYYKDEENNLYVRVNKSEDVPLTYRLIDEDTMPIDYPTSQTAIKNYDLVSGEDDDKISNLTEVSVSETKYILGDAFQIDGLSFQEQSDALAKKIVNDNTTAGINLISYGNYYQTNSIDNVTMNVGVYLDLINEILLNDAKYDSQIKLSTSKVYGQYKSGTYMNYSERYYDDYSIVNGYGYDFSIIFVDRYGKISGSYLDSTVGDNVIQGANSTKNILRDNYGMASSKRNSLEYYEQTELLAEGLNNNQNIAYLNYTDSSKQYTDTISGVSIDVRGLLETVDKSIAESLISSYENGLYAVDDGNAYTYLTVRDNKIAYVNMYDSNLTNSQNEELNADLSLMNINNFDLEFDVLGKVVNYDFKYFDKTYYEDLAYALKNLDDKTFISNEFGYNFIDYLADGSYASVDNIDGEDYLMVINVKKGEIISSVYDKFLNDQSTLISNDNNAYVEAANTLINNQSYLVDYVLSSYDYYNDASLKSVKNYEGLNIDGIDSTIYSSLLLKVFKKACDEQINLDCLAIEKYIDDQVNSVVFISGFRNIPLSLPKSSSSMAIDLSSSYDIEYDIDSHDIEIDLPNSSSYYKFTIDDDIKEPEQVSLKVTITRNISKNAQKVKESNIDFTIYDYTTGCETLFNTYEYKSSKIVAGAHLNLPFIGDDEETITYKDIKYISSDEDVLVNSGYTIGNQIVNDNLKETKDFKVKAYVDLDDNGKLDLGEIAYVYYFTAYTKDDAYDYAKTHAKLGDIDKEIDDDFTVNCSSDIMGVSYLYSVSWSNALSVSNVENNQQTFTVIRQRLKVTPTVYATVLGCDTNQRISFDVEITPRTEKSNKLYAIRTVEKYQIDEVSKNYAALDTDFKFDDFLNDLTYFNDDTKDSVQISSSDFGMYINQETGIFSRTTDQVDEPFDITITVRAAFPSKVAEDCQSYTKDYNVVVMPRAYIKNMIDKELDEFDNINIDISQHANDNIIIQLPTTGIYGISKLSWEAINTDDDVYVLRGNRLVIKTKSGTFTDDYHKEFTLKVTDEYSDYANDKEIKLIVKE